MVGIFEIITSNPVINVSLISWFVAQMLKFLYDYMQTGRFDFLRFMSGSGGMPSSHSAVVCAVCVTVFKVAGWESVEFGLALILAMVVMYDASGVRRAAGEHARVLNTLMEKWSDPEGLEKELKELLGHTPFEVLAGAVLGISIALLL